MKPFCAYQIEVIKNLVVVMSAIIKRVDYLKSYSFVSQLTYVVIEISGHYLDGAADLKSDLQICKTFIVLE